MAEADTKNRPVANQTMGWYSCTLLMLHCAVIAQQGKEFDDELVEQLDVIPKFISACGFLNTKAAGYEADDFLAAACRREEKRGGAVDDQVPKKDALQPHRCRNEQRSLGPLRSARGRNFKRKRPGPEPPKAR